MTRVKDLVLQVKERQQGDFVFAVASQSSPISGGPSLAEILGRYGVKAARMPGNPTTIGPCLPSFESLDSIAGMSLGHKKASRLARRANSLISVDTRIFVQ
jgi:hypothetical protein